MASSQSINPASSTSASKATRSSSASSTTSSSSILPGAAPTQAATPQSQHLPTATRRQIRLATHRILTTLTRQSLLREEEQNALKHQQDGEDISPSEIATAVEGRLKSVREEVLRKSYRYDAIFYMRANTIDEYGDVDTLEGRVRSLSRAFELRALRR